jgi:xylose isomerase
VFSDPKITLRSDLSKNLGRVPPNVLQQLDVMFYCQTMEDIVVLGVWLSETTNVCESLLDCINACSPQPGRTKLQIPAHVT